jgi:hypothetical protein
MAFGRFYSVPNVGGQFTLAGSPKAKLIMDCLQHELWQSASIMHRLKSANSTKLIMHWLQHELWQSASIMHWVKSANFRKRVDE